MATKNNNFFPASLIIRSLTKKLFYAIRRREKAVTILPLIQAGADIDAKDSKGYTPLLLASKYGLKTVVNLLIDSGAIVDNSESPSNCTLLHYSSQHGWTDLVKFIVTGVPVLPCMVHRNCSVSCQESIFPAIHAKDTDGRTALHLASLSGNLKIVKCLLEKGANLLTKNKWGDTVLHEATWKGHLEVVKFLLEKEANLILRNKCGETALHIASFEGHLEVVKFLLEKGANLALRNEKGETALHKASRAGHLKVVKYLLDAGADMEVKSCEGATPLLLAARCLYIKAVVLLINSGANIDCCDDNKCMVLHYASQFGCLELVRYLVKRVPVPPFTLDQNIVSCEESSCLTIHARDMNGRTALHRASSFGRVKVVNFLVEEGAELNTRNKFGETALHEATYSGHLEVVKCLVNRGADANVKDIKGVPPLLYAARFYHKDIVNLLVNSGAYLEDCDEYKNTVLYYAAASGWTQIVQSLVGRMSDLNTRNCFGETALFKACRTGRLETVEYLMKAGASWGIKNNRGYLPINFHTSFFHSTKFLKLFIEAGSYLMPIDYNAIVDNFSLKTQLLGDVKFCCQAIINKFNSHDLPALYELPVSACLPPIEKIMVSSSRVVKAIEQTVELEIQTKGHCNVVEVCPMVLSFISVRSVLEYYKSKQLVFQNQVKRLAMFDGDFQIPRKRKLICLS